MDIYQH
ncbi:uncharacterized protein DMAD_08706, partial [Drosophila madeirensis]